LERTLTLGLRVLLALIGVTAVAAGVVVAVAEVRRLALGSPPVPTILVVLLCGVVLLGGASLIRGALRGRIAVRRPRRRTRGG
jgi:hypothetical protein